MSKCILRVAKINSHGSATGKTTHNYRQAEVPNADPERRHLNQEYLNKGEENIWTLATRRIEQAGIKGMRKDAVRGMEFLITASPDAFERDAAGMIKGNYRKSSWVADNLNFLQQKYGANLVAFTLHQDEKTPHIHAVVVPITADGRLSAKELFNPKSLRSLQTDYAKVMGKYGFERGIEGSRTRHRTMKQIYGQQQQASQEIETDLKALQQQSKPLTIEKPGALDLLNLERWRQQQEAKINAELAQRLDQARKVAEKAQKVAMANATAAEQVKVLQQKLDNSEKLKQAHYKKANQLDRIVVFVDEGRVNKEWIQKQASQVRSQSLPQMEKDLLECLKNLKDLHQLGERLQAKSYDLQPKGNIQYVVHSKTGVRLDLHTVQIGGQSFSEAVTKAMEQTQQKQETKKAKNVDKSIKRNSGPRL